MNTNMIRKPTSLHLSEHRKSIIVACLVALILLAPAIYYVFSPGSSPVFETPTDSYSYLIWVESGTYYAKNGLIGAIDYSGTNATQIFGNVLTALSSSGGSIFIRVGTYTFTSIGGSGVTSYILSIPNNIRIKGEERDKTIFYLANNALPNNPSFVEYNFFRNSDTNNGNMGITIEDITIDGNGANQNSAESQIRLFHAIGMKNSTFQNVVMKNAYGVTLGFRRVVGASDVVPPLGSESYNHDILVENSVFDKNYQTPSAIKPDLGPMGGGIYDSTFRNNEVKNGIYAGLTLRYGRNIIFDNNYVHNNAGNGFGIEGGQEISLTNNVVHSNGATGIYITQPTGLGFNIKDNIVIGNVEGIRIFGGHSRVSIRGNEVRLNTDTGISFFNDTAATFTYIMVTDNTAVDNSNYDYYSNSFAGLSFGVFSNNIGIAGKWLFSGALSNMKFNHNVGFITENVGSGSYSSGAWQAHGLTSTPSSVTLTPTTNVAVWVSAVNATHFQIGVAAGTPTIYWNAVYKPAA